MVKGIQKFKEYFVGKEDNYVLIGGTACDFLMEDSGFSFRATKDLDIVLIVESLDSDFTKLIWKFIQDGEYENRGENNETRQYYRFSKPKNDDFPFMIELFATKPDVLGESGKMKLNRLNEGDLYSLSAIILDSGYYDLIKSNSSVINDIAIAGIESLIILKAKAFINLNEMKKSGKNVDSKDIKKHRNDIIRLSALLTEEGTIVIPDPIKNDFLEFITVLESQTDINLKQFGFRNLTLDELIVRLKNII